MVEEAGSKQFDVRSFVWLGFWGSWGKFWWNFCGFGVEKSIGSDTKCQRLGSKALDSLNSTRYSHGIQGFGGEV